MTTFCCRACGLVYDGDAPGCPVCGCGQTKWSSAEVWCFDPDDELPVTAHGFCAECGAPIPSYELLCPRCRRATEE